MRRTVFIGLLAAVSLGSAIAVDALAGDPIVAGLARPKHPATQKPVSPPDVPPQFLYLVRATLGALHDANTTGNYSVLRDLAAPSLQARHSAADLADLFSAIRRKPVDLAPALYLQPVLNEASRPSPERLHLAGFFALPQSRLSFALAFEAVHGHWRVVAVSIGS